MININYKKSSIFVLIILSLINNEFIDFSTKLILWLAYDGIWYFSAISLDISKYFFTDFSWTVNTNLPLHLSHIPFRGILRYVILQIGHLTDCLLKALRLPKISGRKCLSIFYRFQPVFPSMATNGDGKPTGSSGFHVGAPVNTEAAWYCIDCFTRSNAAKFGWPISFLSIGTLRNFAVFCNCSYPDGPTCHCSG